MKQELQDKLYKKYPKIFRQRDLSPRETCMCYGIEFSDGWYNLIDNLCELLQFHIDKNGYQQIEATQVKEKFGGLRFYTTSCDEYISGIINFAETLSYKICEECGSMKDITQTKGWVRTLCKGCKDKI